MPRVIEDVLQVLSELQQALPASKVDLGDVPAQKLTKLRAEVRTSIDLLSRFSQEIGQFKIPKLVFDPADPHVVGRLIGTTLLEQERLPLGAIERFYGSGVYAIYYLGGFDAYAPISRTDTPIYVGKADPANRYARGVEEQGDRLSRRLGDHRKSVENAENLDIGEFECRYLVVKTAWESTAEDYLINHFKPVWNNEMKVCFGFGKHGDAAETRSNTRSPWDTLHPGRPWAMKPGNVPNPLGVSGVKKAVAQHFASNPPLHPAKIRTAKSKP